MLYSLSYWQYIELNMRYTDVDVSVLKTTNGKKESLSSIPNNSFKQKKKGNEYFHK
jgi:hypothetical protein